MSTLSASTIWEARPGSGSDTNGGGFDPSQTTGMNTDGAATSGTGTAPVFSSASYDFVSGDVGARIYIASGTNWISGWYKIASVAVNAATLDATAGHATLKSGILSTSNGCATTTSPSSATWTIDYSQQNSAQFSYTDLAIQSTNTEVQSSGNPFGKQQVGNTIQVTSGTGFTAGFYTIQSVSGTTATLNASPGTANSTNGNGYQGGALETLSELIGTALASYGVTGQLAYIQASATITLTTKQNISSGVACVLFGYTTYRGDNGQVTVTTATNSTILFNPFSNNIPAIIFRNFIFSTTASSKTDCFQFGSGIAINYMEFDNCTFSSFTYGVNWDAAAYAIHALFLNCTFTSCSSGGVNLDTQSTGDNWRAIFDGCLFNGCNYGIYCQDPNGTIVLNNTVIYNSTSHGIYNDYDSSNYNPTFIYVFNSDFVSNGGDGIRAGGSGTSYPFTVVSINSIYSNNGGYGINFPQSPAYALANILKGRYNAYYNNTSGQVSSNVTNMPGDVTLSGDPFVSASGLNFQLNGTSGAGAACQGTGWPTTIPGE
jgi:hypothetical protein